jgi:hypothetical protein
LKNGRASPAVVSEHDVISRSGRWQESAAKRCANCISSSPNAGRHTNLILG